MTRDFMKIHKALHPRDDISVKMDFFKEEHQKAVILVEKSVITDHTWKEKGNYLLLWDEVKIIDREEH